MRLWLILATLAGLQIANAQVVINGKPLDGQEQRLLQELERAYNTKVVPGRYWYDARSGLWGHEGNPAEGQILPRLPLGGPLSPAASRGNTGVFVNGRQLHSSEVAYLSRCTTVIPGRYWMDENGFGGYEGGPAIFNLATLCRQAVSQKRLWRDLPDPWYGSVMGDDQVVGAIFGASGVTCGADGGCIF